MKKLWLRISLLTILGLPSGYIYAQQVTFGIVTDVHFAEIPRSGTRMYSQSLDKLKECVDTMNKYKVDFIIELGDFKDMSQPEDEQKTLGFLIQVEEVFSGFNGPRYHVLGNHDEDCISKEQFLSVVENTGISSKKSYYSFNSGGFHFVVLDANYDSVGQDFDHGHFNWGDPNIPEKELKWLEKDLNVTQEPVIVFIHQLLDGAVPYQVKNAPQVREILENSGKVKCVFQGHFHEGNYSEINGIHYYTLCSLVSGKKPKRNSYAIVTASADSIKIRGFRKAKSLTLRSGIKPYEFIK
jgi:predicted phosphodiesterase